MPNVGPDILGGSTWHGVCSSHLSWTAVCKGQTGRVGGTQRMRWGLGGQGESYKSLTGGRRVLQEPLALPVAGPRYARAGPQPSGCQGHHHGAPGELYCQSPRRTHVKESPMARVFWTGWLLLALGQGGGTTSRQPRQEEP
jgi:hypothetical protein